MSDDPDSTPLVHQVLYSNDVTRLVSGFVVMLFTIAEPDRVKKALEAMLQNWDERVRTSRELYEAMAKQQGELSGWRDRENEN